MKHKLVNSIRALLLVPLTGLYIASAVAQTQTPPTHGATTNQSPGHVDIGSEKMSQAMLGGMDAMHKMPLTGNTDKDFAMMMKMHHQQGVDMAKVQLAEGKSPVMKAMATQIIAAQQKEIALFDQWLAKQK